MAYTSPIIKTELVRVNHYNEKLTHRITLVQKEFHRLTRKGTSARRGLQHKSRLIRDLVNLRLELEFLHDDLKRLSNSPNRYFSATNISILDIWLAKGFLNRAAANTKKAIKLITKIIKRLDRYFIKGHSFSRRRRLILTFILAKLYLLQNTSCIFFLTKQNHTKHLISEYRKDPGKMLISESDLKVGDVVLSYKENRFLLRHGVSLMIALVEGSRFTHSSIVAKHLGNSVLCLNASGYERKLALLPVEPEEGEVLFVFRPNLGKKARERLLKNISYWRENLDRLGDMQFSIVKFFFAVIEGLLYRAVDITTKKIIMVQNPFKQRTRYYCSEIVNLIFIMSGIFLSTRSQYSDLVGPCEFSWSPYLNLIGVIDKKPISRA